MVFQKGHKTNLGKTWVWGGVLRMAEDNPAWRGDNVGNTALHKWVKSRLRKRKPDLCEICNKRPPRDLANRTGIYNRDFNNWWNLCRRCHFRFDHPKELLK